MIRVTRALTLGCLLLMPATALAQSPERRTPTAAVHAGPREPRVQQALRLAASAVPVGELRQAGSAARQPARRSARRRVFGASVGAAGGFFVGGYTGAWIEGDRCHCDDPGLKGALIGAPVGAAVGGVLGALYLF